MRFHSAPHPLSEEPPPRFDPEKRCPTRGEAAGADLGVIEID
jgi:hypothetical protein